MRKPDTSAYQDFGQVTERLDQIVATVRDKDTSLERSLDLFDEAISLGSRAVDLVDKVDFTPEEKERLADVDVADDSAPETDDPQTASDDESASTDDPSDLSEASVTTSGE